MNRALARDLINKFVTESFRDATTAVTGTPGELRYQGIRPATGVPLVPSNDVYWARITVQTAAESQETLRCEGKRRFVTTGSVIVQMFFPTLDVNAQPNLDLITQRVNDDFRHYPSDKIEFTRSRVDDNILAEPNWLRANLVSQFTYRQFT